MASSTGDRVRVSARDPRLSWQSRQAMRFQRIGWVLLGLLGLSTVAGLGWVSEQGEAIVEEARLIDRAGFQRTLSERVVKATLQMQEELLHGNAEAARIDRQEAIQAMRDFEPILIAALARLKIGEQPVPPEVLHLLQEGLQEAAQTGDHLLAQAKQKDFVNAMDQVVAAFQRDFRTQVERFWYTLAGLLVLELTLIGLVGWRVIGALANANQNFQRELAERQLIRQMTEMVHSSSTREEMSRILRTYLQRLFPGLDGAVYLFGDSREMVEAVAVWGNQTDVKGELGIEDCWALRLGKPYGLLEARHPSSPVGPSSTKSAGSLDGIGKDNHVPCAHAGPGSLPWLCIPMLAEGEALGVFQVRFSADRVGSTNPDDAGRYPQRVEELVEGLAVTLANVQLRQTLRNQSIRDSLTGLFNRRYMEETLSRELRRAERHQYPAAMVVADLDKFKALNDTFGHAVGDDVLAAFGRFLGTHCRPEDIVCRYGGEEFVVICPNLRREDAGAKFDQLREEWSSVMVDNRIGGYTSATFSAGTASYPDDAATPDALFRAADAALYRAKSEGRDRVVVLGSGSLDGALQRRPASGGNVHPQIHDLGAFTRTR